jgi:hypothetical protein
VNVAHLDGGGVWFGLACGRRVSRTCRRAKYLVQRDVWTLLPNDVDQLVYSLPLVQIDDQLLRFVCLAGAAQYSIVDIQIKTEQAQIGLTVPFDQDIAQADASIAV